MEKTLCGHCGVEFYSPWEDVAINCLNPIRSGTAGVGTLHATTCASCGQECLEYTSMTEGSERVPVFPQQGDLTLEVVITLVIELENYRRKASNQPTMSDAEKKECRARQDIVDKAKSLIHATAASAMGGAAANAITGLLLG